MQTQTPYVKLTPKKAFAEREKLHIAADADGVAVRGETFSLRISSRNGLISSLKALDDEFLPDGGCYPDMMVADKFDTYAGSEFRARHCTDAKVEILQGDPEYALIRASGQYSNLSGAVFPLRYVLYYQVFIDGQVIITAENEALEDLRYTWLIQAGGEARGSLCKYFARMGDNAQFRSSSTYVAGCIEQNGPVFAGEFVPWFWIGNERTGLDIYLWEYDEHAWNLPDGGKNGILKEYGQPSDMVRLLREAETVRWEAFVARSVPFYLKKGERRAYNFGIGVTPPKFFDAARCLVKTKVEGPFQLNPSFVKIPAERIDEIADAGYELLIGGASSPSGICDPINPEGFAEGIANCHKRGMRLIPYVTATDLNLCSSAYREHGIDWAVKPMITHKNATQLMCHGSEGWREFWKARLSSFIERFDIDGLYIDMWYGKLACENGRHGCGGGGGPRSVNYLGTREMLCHAYNAVRSKNPDFIVNINTNVMPLGMLASLCDARVVGESIGGISDAFGGDDSDEGGVQSGDFLFSSCRLGCASNIIWHGFSASWSEEKRLAYAMLVNFAPQTWDDKKNLITHDSQIWSSLRRIEPRADGWRLGLAGAKAVEPSERELVCNLIEGDDGIVVELINWTSRNSVNAAFSLRGEVLAAVANACDIYDAVSGEALAMGADLEKFVAGEWGKIDAFSAKALLVIPAGEGRDRN